LTELFKVKLGSSENFKGDGYVMGFGGGRGDTVQSTRKTGLSVGSLFLFLTGESSEHEGENGRFPARGPRPL
jgi:hypothetical protein